MDKKHWFHKHNKEDRLKEYPALTKLTDFFDAESKELHPPVYHVGFDEYMNSIIEAQCGIKYFDDFHLIETEGVPLFKLLADSKISESNSEARKLIRGGGVKVNYKTINNEFEKINESHLREHSTILITIGKNNQTLIKVRRFKNKDPEIQNWDLYHYDPKTKEFIFEENGLRNITL